MKIVLLAPRSEIHTVRWANALAERGHSVHIISGHNNSGDPLCSDVYLHKINIWSFIGYYTSFFKVRGILNEVAPDLFHAHYASGYGALGRLVGYHPYVLSVWGNDVYEFPYRSPLHRSILRKNLCAADCLCSTSQAMADQAYEATNVPSSKFHITPFGVKMSKFTLSKKSVFSTQEEIFIGTVKKLEKKYGIDLLLNSFARLLNSLNDNKKLRSRLRLLIVGGGPDREKLESLSETLGIRDVTSFAGKISHEEVPTYLSKLDIFVALSRYESFGVAVIEASACGLPVVVSEVGGLPEVVKDRKTGLIVPDESPKAAAEAIKSLLVNPSLSRKMGRLGRKHVKNNYSWSSSVSQMEYVYNSVLSSNNKSKQKW